MDSHTHHLHVHRVKTPVVKIHKNFKKVQQLVVRLRTLQAHLLEQELSVETLDRLIAAQKQAIKRLKSRMEIHEGLVSRLQTRLDPLEGPHMLKNSMFVDYLIRGGAPPEACQEMARCLEVDGVTDTDVLIQGLSIYNEVKNNHNLRLLMDWCIENERFLLPASDVGGADTYTFGKYGLMFECHIQHCVELILANDLFLAYDEIRSLQDNHAQFPAILRKLSSLPWLLQLMQLDSTSLHHTKQNDPFDYYTETTVTLKDSLISLINDPDKWDRMATLFWTNFKAVYGLPQTPPLLTMLNMGASAVKCLKCSDVAASVSPITPVSLFFSGSCPVCSIPALASLLASVPANYRSKSSIYQNPVLFPNHRILPLGKLLSQSSNLNDLGNLGLCSSGDNSNLIYKNNRGFVSPAIVDMSLSEAQKRIPAWTVEDPTSFVRCQIADLQKAFVA